jgi:ArsR family transcriptional regulator
MGTMNSTPEFGGDARLIHAAQILTALAEPTRLAALGIIWDGHERCVCELMRALQATQSRMSRHMSVLKVAGLVIDRRDAQWVRYRRASNLPPDVVALVDAALALASTKERAAACR